MENVSEFFRPMMRQQPRRASQSQSQQGLGQARNMLVVASGDAVIALPGSTETLSEVALALTIGKSVIAIQAWSQIEGVVVVETSQEAVERALRAA